MKTYSPHRHHTKLNSPTHSRCTAPANKTNECPKLVHRSLSTASHRRNVNAKIHERWRRRRRRRTFFARGLRPSMPLLPLPTPPTYGRQTLHTYLIYNHFTVMFATIKTFITFIFLCTLNVDTQQWVMYPDTRSPTLVIAMRNKVSTYRFGACGPLKVIRVHIWDHPQ